HLERVGFFNPLAAESEEGFRLDRERYDYWLSVGAKPSERVTQLVKAHSEAA
ncbi:MAG: 30S ribosomal protein S16, partial [Gammaproteobacteria bacterium]